MASQSKWAHKCIIFWSLHCVCTHFVISAFVVSSKTGLISCRKSQYCNNHRVQHTCSLQRWQRFSAIRCALCFDYVFMLVLSFVLCIVFVVSQLSTHTHTHRSIFDWKALYYSYTCNSDFYYVLLLSDFIDLLFDRSKKVFSVKLLFQIPRHDQFLCCGRYTLFAISHVRLPMCCVDLNFSSYFSKSTVAATSFLAHSYTSLSILTILSICASIYRSSFHFFFLFLISSFTAYLTITINNLMYDPLQSKLNNAQPLATIIL